MKEIALIQSRMAKVEIEGHFGLVRKLSKNLAEFKWKNGLRVYFCTINEGEKDYVLLLLGGRKNSQQRDIKKAKSMILKFQERI